MSNHEIVPGVSIDPEHRYAKFQRGSLAVLAVGIRDALWSRPLLFDEAEPLFVYVGGERRESEEPALEVMGQPEDEEYLVTMKLPDPLRQKLEKVRSSNLPNKRYAYWSCDCAEYCDQSHGEGRLELEVRRPTFREVAAAQKTR